VDELWQFFRITGELGIQASEGRDADRPYARVAVLENGLADETELAQLAEALPAWAEDPAAYCALLRWY
jgi:hypothetical protein